MNCAIRFQTAILHNTFGRLHLPFRSIDNIFSREFHIGFIRLMRTQKHTNVCVSGGKKLKFFKNFANVLNEWSHNRNFYRDKAR